MPHTPTRIFALDPNSKGFGYAVFELPFRLVEWGLSRTSGEKLTGALMRFEKLLARFRPDVVVFEDATAPGSRRRPRIRVLIEALMKRARELGIAVHTVARLAVVKCFTTEEGTATKYSIAKRLARHFPDLAAKLPPPRKIYETEPDRLAVFDALALAVTFAQQ